MRIKIKPFNDRVSFTPVIKFLAAKPCRDVARSGRLPLGQPLLPKLRGATDTDLR